MKLHGFNVLLNQGNTYPQTIANTPLFNAPLVELVHQACDVLGRTLTLVDVGAAIGDTVLLLKVRCRGAVGRFFCIEGDNEFFGLLKHNT